MRPDNRADSEDLRLSGAVCRFELVRGGGDGEVARLAELQHGHIHLHQLRAAGIGKNAVAHRVRTGRLHATLPCIYLVGRPQTDVFGRMMAAALHFKGDALISSQTAAYLWGLLDTTQALRDDRAIDVLLVGRNANCPTGVRIQRARSLERRDVRRRNGIPVTSPARTILDLAATMDDLELEAALTAALRRNLVRRSHLGDVMERHPRSKGVGRLRALLDQPQSLHDTRSKYERKLLKLLELAELPVPITNTYVAGKLVDGFWPDLKLVLEFDGWRYHRARDRFENDRLRDQHLTVAGHQVIRVTGRQIDHTPYALVARIAGMITMLRLRASAS